MKKILTTLVLGFTFTAIALAGTKCFSCNGTGWKGQFKCSTCGGDGETGN